MPKEQDALGFSDVEPSGTTESFAFSARPSSRKCGSVLVRPDSEMDELVGEHALSRSPALGSSIQRS
jgi:hypothetical protein